MLIGWLNDPREYNLRRLLDRPIDATDRHDLSPRNVVGESVCTAVAEIELQQSELDIRGR